MKNPIAEGINTAIQRPSKPLSDRYRIHVIDRAAQILDSFGFDYQELSVSDRRQDRFTAKHGAPNLDGA